MAMNTVIICHHIENLHYSIENCFITYFLRVVWLSLQVETWEGGDEG